MTLMERNIKVLIYEDDSQTAGTLAFAVRQFDLIPVMVQTFTEAQNCILKERPLIAFLNARFPLPECAEGVTVVPVFDRAIYRDELLSASRCCSILQKPVTVFDCMAVIKNILEPGIERTKNFVYQMLRAKTMLRHLLLLADLLAEDQDMQLSMSEGIYEYCVSTCPLAISGDPPAGDNKTYHLLTVSVQHGRRQCAFYEGCKLHQFSAWLQQNHADVFGMRPCDALPQSSDNLRTSSLREGLANLIKQQDAALTRLYELKKMFCTSCCDRALNGTDFKHGDVLISEWADIFRNQCLYCPQPDCPLNRFFELIVYRLKTV